MEIAASWHAVWKIFCDYYGIKGDAHSFEKLTLVRLRMIGGNYEFGKQVERIRDELIYTSNSINITRIGWNKK